MSWSLLLKKRICSNLDKGDKKRIENGNVSFEIMSIYFDMVIRSVLAVVAELQIRRNSRDNLEIISHIFP